MPELTQPTVATSPAALPSAVAPAVADNMDKALDPNSVIVARLVATVWMTILGAPLVALTVALFVFGRLGVTTWAWLGVGYLAYAALVAWSLVWPAVRYRHASYRLAERGLWIRRGVLWRSEILVPKSRVQHTDVSQGPIERRFDLATLVLHTAGTQHAAVALGGLAHSAALSIRDYLIGGGQDDAV